MGGGVVRSLRSRFSLGGVAGELPRTVGSDQRSGRVGRLPALLYKKNTTPTQKRRCRADNRHLSGQSTAGGCRIR